MSKLEQIIEYNKNFINNKDYEEYVTTKIPKKENGDIILYGY